MRKAGLEGADRQVLVRGLARDLAAAYLDGLDVDEPRIESMVLEGTEPRGDEERVVLSAARLAMGADRYSRARISPLAMMDLEDAVSGRDLRFRSGKVPGAARYSPRPRVETGGAPLTSYGDEEEGERCEQIACIYDCRDDQPFAHPLVNMGIAACAMMDLRPLKRWNALVEIVLRHIYLERNGYSALRWVPFGELLLDWSRGAIKPPDVPGGPLDFDPDIGLGLDHTPISQSHLRLIEKGLGALVEELAEARDSTASVREKIGAVEGLNRRQRRVLLGFATGEYRSMRIEAHRALYGVVYATARSDLVGLEERGLLESGYEGRALVFRAADGLVRLLG